MLLELAFVACLSTSHDTCRDENLLFSDVPMRVCMSQGQAQLARWAVQHPDWVIRRWSCRRYNPSIAKV